MLFTCHFHTKSSSRSCCVMPILTLCLCSVHAAKLRLTSLTLSYVPVILFSVPIVLLLSLVCPLKSKVDCMAISIICCCLSLSAIPLPLPCHVMLPLCYVYVALMLFHVPFILVHAPFIWCDAFRATSRPRSCYLICLPRDFYCISTQLHTPFVLCLGPLSDSVICLRSSNAPAQDTVHHTTSLWFLIGKSIALMLLCMYACYCAGVGCVQLLACWRTYAKRGPTYLNNPLLTRGAGPKQATCNKHSKKGSSNCVRE